MTIFYTGKGDKGKSALGARKIAKDDPLFEVLGALDELNSWLGVCRSGLKFKSLRFKVRNIQETLFIAQAEIGTHSKLRVAREKTRELEREILKIDKVVPSIKKFIIPGAGELSAKLDYARALARRAERAAVKARVSGDLLQYFNRLSSYLFALARLVNFRLKLKEENPKYR